MSEDYRASVDNVRQYLHLPDWDVNDIPDQAIENYIDDANLLVDEEGAEADRIVTGHTDSPARATGGEVHR